MEDRAMGHCEAAAGARWCRRVLGMIVVATALAASVGAPAQMMAPTPVPARDQADDAAWRRDYEAGWEALNLRDYDAANKWLRASFEVARPFPHSDLRKVASVGSLGWLRVLQGRYDAAEPLTRWALAV